jgi:hypothetical protein
MFITTIVRRKASIVVVSVDSAEAEAGVCIQDLIE